MSVLEVLAVLKKTLEVYRRVSREQIEGATKADRKVDRYDEGANDAYGEALGVIEALIQIHSPTPKEVEEHTEDCGKRSGDESDIWASPPKDGQTQINKADATNQNG